MTSARKAFANRANGSLSRGPRTAAGKVRRATAAFQHGLSLPVLRHSALPADVDALVREIVASQVGPGRLAHQISQSRVDPRLAAGRPINDALHALATRIAEAMIDLRRVRLAKRPLSIALDADPANIATLKALARLDRYERRALSRRKFAIREFAAALAGIDPAARTRRMRWTGFRDRFGNFGRTSQLG